jgi:hypothetical protein
MREAHVTGLPATRRLPLPPHPAAALALFALALALAFTLAVVFGAVPTTRRRPPMCWVTTRTRSHSEYHRLHSLLGNCSSCLPVHNLLYQRDMQPPCPSPHPLPTLLTEGVIYALVPVRAPVRDAMSDDPAAGPPVYVGQTSKSAFARWHDHVNSAFGNSPRHTPLHHTIRHMGAAAFAVVPLQQVRGDRGIQPGLG